MLIGTRKTALSGGLSAFLNVARSTRLELATSRVHLIPYFRRGVDYIFTSRNLFP